MLRFGEVYYKFSAKEKDEETSNNPTSASPERGGTTAEQFTNIILIM